jgi:gamma-glutamyltranspeptidase / glutathione hydrolase
MSTLVALCLISPLSAQSGLHLDQPVSPQSSPAVMARNGMVVAQEARAARIGAEILRRGGNAVDAAIATGFALAVTYPRAGNIGGGGYMVIHLGATATETTIDFRETAPAAITRASFLDERGEADAAKSRESALGIGVPGTVAGLSLAHAKYGSGRFSLAELLAPAIALARDGIPIEDDTADSLPSAQTRLGRWPASRALFFAPDGRLKGPGDTLVQPDLAETLAAIARAGPRAFYADPIAGKISAGVRAAGGVMTNNDLADYQPIERAPLIGSYRNYPIISMPPSSSGGVVLLEMLNILEGYPDLATDEARRLHLAIEAMKLAYADRAAFLGDPAQVRAPIDKLISKQYAAALRAGIDPHRARPSAEIKTGAAMEREGANTTHFSVMDRDGNAVATTVTLNLSYGVGLIADGTGVLLNNELDDFAAKPGAPNAYGLTGGEANAPAGGKRPLSSMTPTIVLKDGRPWIVTGSPGGSRIITTVLQVLLNVIDRNLALNEAVAAPRLHHQWLPDLVVAEPGVDSPLLGALEARGQRVVESDSRWSSANSIMVKEQGLVGAADNRTRGALASGY